MLSILNETFALFCRKLNSSKFIYFHGLSIYSMIKSRTSCSNGDADWAMGWEGNELYRWSLQT